MAKRKSVKKSAKKATKKAVKQVVKKTAKKPAAKPRAKRAVASSKPAAAPASRIGMITHTELASTNPPATRAWCETALGWKFGDPVPTPTGPYHMWRFENNTGGGIRTNNPPEVPGSIPYVEVASIQASFAKAIAAGATEMLAPSEIPGGMGWIAIVAEPGGVAIGFWAQR